VNGEHQESDDGWPSIVSVIFYELDGMYDDPTSHATKTLTLQET